MIRAICIAGGLSAGLAATALADANPNATLIYFDAVSNQTLDPQGLVSGQRVKLPPPGD